MEVEVFVELKKVSLVKVEDQDLLEHLNFVFPGNTHTDQKCIARMHCKSLVSRIESIKKLNIR